MIATLTGLGLSSAAGLNAYIPLLVVGLLARFTDLVPLGSTWSWLEHPVTLICLTVLLVVELVADKVPALDSLNDVVQTVIRPSSGGITFGAGAASVELSDLSVTASGAAAGDGVDWSSVLAGVAVALVLHVLKSVSRPVVNTLTGGVGGPVASVVEDVVSVVTAILAVLIPILILVVFPLLVLTGVWAVRRRRRLRARRREARDAASDAV
ncbi:DUF4126 domain-containing protein [Nocardiopsis sp. NPDC050513]|uniref:DUF4126 domain-containing protein n=1 Tax=Nocardiopsis sp. NPDC050513 TaxID=3364338 RepID=UPI0037BD1BE4